MQALEDRWGVGWKGLSSLLYGSYARRRSAVLGKETALMEFAGVGAATFAAEGRGRTTGLGSGGKLGQCVGGVGGDVEHDEISDAHDVVASGETMRGISCGTLPVHDGKQSGDAAGLVAAQAEKFSGDAHEAPNAGVFCSMRRERPMELSY